MAVGQTGFGRRRGSDWISGRDEMTTDCGPRWHWEEIEPLLQIASKSGLNLFNSTTFFYSSISVLDYTTSQFFDVDLP